MPAIAASDNETLRRASAAALDVLREILGNIEPPCALRLPDGTTWLPTHGAPVLTIVVREPAGLRQLLWARDQAALAESYLRGDLDIEGDIFAVPAVTRAILNKPRRLAERLRIVLKLARLPNASVHNGATPDAALHGTQHSLERDRAAVTHHYDVSNAFYQLFLDESMAYTCAAFADPHEDLASAQRRKLDLICRKLRLQPGEKLLDIGCGWGALLLYAMREYGVQAVGITLSERQAELARQRIAAAGLTDRCRIELTDYRALGGEGVFDKIVSVGMFEHVGRAQAAAYFAAVHRLLRPGGAYLHHAIVANPRVRPNRGDTLVQRYVFPDTELIPIGEVLTTAELAGLEARDLESLREHYALTLRRWIGALDARHAEAVAEVGEATYRAWRLVFAGAAYCFETNVQGVTQVLMVKPHPGGRAELPLLRTDWYARPL